MPAIKQFVRARALDPLAASESVGTDSGLEEGAHGVGASEPARAGNSACFDLILKEELGTLHLAGSQVAIHRPCSESSAGAAFVPAEPAGREHLEGFAAFVLAESLDFLGFGLDSCDYFEVAGDEAAVARVEIVQ